MYGLVKKFMCLIFSYEILGFVEEEVFMPTKEGKGKLLFASMARSEILNRQTLNWYIMLVSLQGSICNSTKTIKVQKLLLKTIHMYTDVAELAAITTALFFKNSIQV